jgi:sec-independent protein translocase protein TatA
MLYCVLVVGGTNHRSANLKRKGEYAHMPFNIGPFELILILLIVIIIFGVGKLPELGSALGQGIREFRRGTQGLDELTEETESKNKKAEETK